MSTIASEVRSLLSSFPCTENNLTGLGTRGKRKRGNPLLIVLDPPLQSPMAPQNLQKRVQTSLWVPESSMGTILPSCPPYLPYTDPCYMWTTFQDATKPSWLAKDVPCCAKLLQSCLTLCDPMDCSPPGSSVHGTLQARILDFAAMPSSRGSSQPRC